MNREFKVGELVRVSEQCLQEGYSPGERCAVTFGPKSNSCD
jgi:hypothetical protein